MFWNKFIYLCEHNNVKPNTVGKELGITSGTITGWKKGAVPNSDALNKIANYFDTTVEYLLTEDEIYIKPSEKKNSFTHLFSLPQRWSSLRHGDPLNDDQMTDIAKFTNCTLRFLYSKEEKDYSPKIPDEEFSIAKPETLEIIISVMDRCADNDDIKTLQIQLSHIVRYRLKNAGIGYEELRDNREKYHAISLDKLDFLYNDRRHIDITIDYGFNLTELDVIREKTGLSFLYLFTGKEYADISDKD